MAFNYSSPDLDASLGLIFRLNDLWARADRRALSGDINAWELVLDRIFSNLLYREEIEVETNGDDEVIDVGLSAKDIAIWRNIKNKIKKAKIVMMKARAQKKIKLFNLAMEKHYSSVMLYDIWLRKYMQQELRLYLKETESNPSQALFGGAFGGKMRKTT